MAVSKNNRRKGKKRAKGRAAQARPAEAARRRSYDWLGMVGLALMLAGFLGAMFTPYGLVFYPVTFAGAVIGLVQTRRDAWHHKITFVCYIIYCIAVAVMWVGMLTGRMA
ncbi:MAG TPA: hypothetical protein IAA32_01850 [Candidatus Butyricicoccus stercorigallinarum]|nr:hypothetical protein [Candidatus Butyricicoccus stercorigallinarum]